ncbi:MAG: hypothetical protein WCP21_18435, partial [Armatimonadota bacterium]
MMTFDQAVQRYAQLRNEVLAGRLSQEQFVAELANLQVQDQAGTWWRPDPATGNWLYFDGAAWRPYQAAPSPAPQPTPAPTAGPAPAAWAASPQAGGPMAGQKGL